MWTGAILAGGRARRLGGLNKAGLTLQPGGASILDRQVARLRRVVDRTIIIANDAERFSTSGVPVIRDLVPDGGPLGALYTAITAARGHRTLVVACDMPFVSEPLLAYLVSVGDTADITIPKTARGYEPLCATYSPRSGDELRRMIDAGRQRLSDVARIPGLTIREIGRDELENFGPEEVLFFNLNTPDDHARAIDIDGEYHYPS
jgi:molybdopterin-guanine dinucleotide biosynthesis protein A